jgi:hypothetical protein
MVNQYSHFLDATRMRVETGYLMTITQGTQLESKS